MVGSKAGGLAVKHSDRAEQNRAEQNRAREQSKVADKRAEQRNNKEK